MHGLFTWVTRYSPTTREVQALRSLFIFYLQRLKIRTYNAWLPFSCFRTLTSSFLPSSIDTYNGEPTGIVDNECVT